MDGCSVQYAENSVRDVVPRMNGGAVNDERSPLNDAIDWRYYQRGSGAWFRGVTYFQECSPRAFVLRCNAITFTFGRARHDVEGRRLMLKVRQRKQESV